MQKNPCAVIKTMSVTRERCTVPPVIQLVVVLYLIYL